MLANEFASKFALERIREQARSYNKGVTVCCRCARTRERGVMVLTHPHFLEDTVFKRSLIAALFLVPALGFAADNATTTAATAPKGERASHFNKADADGNGMLSRAEVERSLPRLAKKFDQIDTNKDGQLARDELKAGKKTRKQAHKKEHTDRQASAAQRFKHADTDGDGAISRAEAEKHAPRLAKRFDQIDSNKDGKLNQDELRAYREAKRSREQKA